MQAVLQSQIFFFITSIFVVVLIVVLAVCSFYIIRILKDFADISKMLKATVTDAHGELERMGEHVRESKLYTFFFGTAKKAKRHAPEK